MSNTGRLIGYNLFPVEKIVIYRNIIIERIETDMRIKIAVLLIFLGSLPGMAENWNNLGIPYIHNYDFSKETRSEQIWSIAQGHQGLMYFALTKGVLEFDGKYWSTIIVGANLRVLKLAADNNEVIYVAAEGDFGFLNKDNSGKTVFVSLLDKLNPEFKKPEMIIDIFPTSHGIYFMGNENLYHFFKGRIQVYPLLKGMSGCVQNNKLILLNQAGNIHIYESDKVSELTFDPIKNFIMSPRGVFPYSTETLLVISNNQGCYLLDLPAEKTESIRLHPFSTNINNYLIHHTPYGGVILNEVQYAIGTRKGGIVCFDKSGQLVWIISENQGLMGNTILDLFKDKSNNLWVGLNAGISHIELSSPLTRFGKFHQIKEMVLSVINFNQKIYAGTFTQCLYWPGNRTTDNYQNHQPFLPVNNINSGVWDFTVIRDKLLAASEHGIFEIQEEQGILIPNSSFAYCFGKTFRFPDLIFCGLQSNQGVDIIEYKNNHFKFLMRIPNLSTTVRKITTDHLGNLWISSQHNGIFLLDFKQNDIKNPKITHYDKSHGLPDLSWNTVHCLNQEILIDTQVHGFYQPEYSVGSSLTDKTLHFVPTKNPIWKNIFGNSSDSIYDLGNNSFFMDGYCQYLKKNSTGTYDHIRSPFQQIKERIYRSYIDNSEIYWLAALNGGLFRFDSRKQKNYQEEYPAIIHKAILKDDSEILPEPGLVVHHDSEKGQIVKEIHFPQVKTIIPYNNNSIIFEYSAVFYEHLFENNFSYLLKNHDANWSEWTLETRKEYTNLPEGDYYFAVKAKNIFEHISQTAEFHFTIQPPWYRSYWSYMTYIFLFVLLLYGLLRLNSRRLLAAKQKLEDIVAQRTVEVIKKKNEIEVYAGELHTMNQELIETKNALWGEMELAKKIQTVLLPKNPKIPGYDIAVFMKPAEEVGGDYYDVIKVEEEQRLEVRGWRLDAKRADEKDRDPCRGGSCARPNDSGQPPETPPTDPSSPKSGQPQEYAPTDILTTNHLPTEGGLTTVPKPSYWIVIGDVSGHGVPAGLIMMMVQMGVHLALHTNPHAMPQEILASVNRVLFNNIKKMGEDKYMTITILSCLEHGVFKFSGLHQDIMIYRANQKTVELVETVGMWLGMTDQITNMLSEGQLVLHPDDCMLLYTDGIPEARDNENKMYSEAKLATTFQDLGDLPAENIKNGIIQSLNGYTCDDDVTLVLVKRILET
jgi:serine phosphatase RsbU (regulator of sigma subunit)/ligand-binding sensor domain-containing protein